MCNVFNYRFLDRTHLKGFENYKVCFLVILQLLRFSLLVFSTEFPLKILCFLFIDFFHCPLLFVKDFLRNVLFCIFLLRHS